MVGARCRSSVSQSFVTKLSTYDGRDQRDGRSHVSTCFGLPVGDIFLNRPRFSLPLA